MRNVPDLGLDQALVEDPISAELAANYDLAGPLAGPPWELQPIRRLPPPKSFHLTDDQDLGIRPRFGRAVPQGELPPLLTALRDLRKVIGPNLGVFLGILAIGALAHVGLSVLVASGVFGPLASGVLAALGILTPLSACAAVAVAALVACEGHRPQIGKALRTSLVWVVPSGLGLIACGYGLLVLGTVLASGPLQALVPALLGWLPFLPAPLNWMVFLGYWSYLGFRLCLTPVGAAAEAGGLVRGAVASWKATGRLRGREMRWALGLTVAPLVLVTLTAVLADATGMSGASVLGTVGLVSLFGSAVFVPAATWLYVVSGAEVRKVARVIIHEFPSDDRRSTARVEHCPPAPPASGTTDLQTRFFPPAPGDPGASDGSGRSGEYDDPDPFGPDR